MACRSGSTWRCQSSHGRVLGANRERSTLSSGYARGQVQASWTSRVATRYRNLACRMFSKSSGGPVPPFQTPSARRECASHPCSLAAASWEGSRVATSKTGRQYVSLDDASLSKRPAYLRLWSFQASVRSDLVHQALTWCRCTRRGPHDTSNRTVLQIEAYFWVRAIFLQFSSFSYFIHFQANAYVCSNA